MSSVDLLKKLQTNTAFTFGAVMQSVLLLGHTVRYVQKSFPSAFSANKMAVKGAKGKNFSCQHSEHLQKVINRRRRNNSDVMTSMLTC